MKQHTQKIYLGKFVWACTHRLEIPEREWPSATCGYEPVFEFIHIVVSHNAIIVHNIFR